MFKYHKTLLCVFFFEQTLLCVTLCYVVLFYLVLFCPELTKKNGYQSVHLYFSHLKDKWLIVQIDFVMYAKSEI